MEKGLRYNKGKLRWSLVHYKSLEPMIRVLMYGAEKYTTEKASGDHNWKKGMPPHEVLECLQRHLAALMDGEVNDKESGLPHIGHLLCNAMFYSYFTESKCCGNWNEEGECKCKTDKVLLNDPATTIKNRRKKKP